MGDLAGVVLDGSLLLAVPIALAAGVLSFFTPCSLPLVPGYLSYVAGMAGSESAVVQELRGGERTRRGRTMLGATLFVLGFSAVFVSYGAVFGGISFYLVAYQDLIIRITGAFTIVLGLLFAGAGEKMPLLGRTVRPRTSPRIGLVGAPFLGAVFGIGWTPCIGPALTAVLALSASSGTAGRGALLAFAYALGLGAPFILAAAYLTRALRVFGWMRARSRWVMLVGGVLLVVVGVLQVSGIWSTLVYALQGIVGGWRTAI